MTIAALILAIFGLIAALLLFGALVEIYRQVDQLRQQAGLMDEPISLDFDSTASLEAIGEPAIWEGAQHNGRFVVLVLSTSCTTCAAVASGLPRKRTPNLVCLVVAGREEEALAWMTQQGLEHGPYARADIRGRISERFGLSTSPVAIRFEGTRPVGATTVPSKQHTKALFDWIHKIGDSSFDEEQFTLRSDFEPNNST